MRKDWKIVKLGEFATHEKGKKPKNQKTEQDEVFKFPYINIEAFEKGVIETYTDGEKCRFCFEDDFLMVWDGSRSGLVGKGMNGALGSTLVRINLPGIENNYAYHFLSSKYQEINTRAKGSGTPHVDPYLLWNYDFSICSLPEQRAIVAKIEELFSDLDKGVADLKKAQNQLKVYRQAVLKKAFDLKSKSYKIEEVCKEIFAGGDKPKDFFSKIKTEECKIPIIANAVANNGLYGYTKHARVNESAITIAARGSGTGHVELRKKPFLPIVRLITIIPDLEKVEIQYLMYFLRNLNIDKSGSAIPQLTIPMVKGFKIHLPSKEKQHQIVQEIESRLSVCDKVEESITESLEKSLGLRQSILKKAFEGRLLSNEEINKSKTASDYEPAEILLKKIKLEKK